MKLNSVKLLLSGDQQFSLAEQMSQQKSFINMFLVIIDKLVHMTKLDKGGQNVSVVEISQMTHRSAKAIVKYK